MELLAAKFQVKARVLVCDSAACHVKARRLLKAEYSDLLVLPCYAHQINLWVKDVLQLPSFVATCKKALSVRSIVSSRSLLLGRSRSHCSTMFPSKSFSLQMPTETRWYSFYQLFRTISDYQSVFFVSRSVLF